MIVNMNGLVLHERMAGEKGRFLDILTQEQGVVEVYVRGAKKITSKSTSVTQLFSYASFCLEQRGEMYYFQSARPIRIFYALRDDLEHLSLASYFSELIRQAVPSGKQENEILRLVLNTFHYLTEGKREAAVLKPLFELRFAAELGFMPDVLMCRECMDHLPEELVYTAEEGSFVCMECYTGTPGTDIPMKRSGLEMIRHIVLSDFERLFGFRVTGRTLEDVTDFAEKFVSYHLSVHPRALDFYRQVKALR